MQVKLYLDVLFLVNFVVGFFVLLMTSFLLNLHTKWWRIILGSVFGTVTLLFLLFMGVLFHPWKSLLIYIGISLEANIICFGLKKGLLCKWLLSTTIMVLIGSCMNYIRYSFGLTVLVLFKWMLCFFVAEVVIIILFLSIKFYKAGSCRIYTVNFIHHGGKVCKKLYLDTGNMLRDPLFGKPVIVLSDEVVKSCFTLEENRLLGDYFNMGIFNYIGLHSNEMQKKYCFHEIPYQSVGNTNGKLLCFLMDEVEITELKITLYKQPVAIAPPGLFKGKTYQGLLHPNCISL